MKSKITIRFSSSVLFVLFLQITSTMTQNFNRRTIRNRISSVSRFRPQRRFILDDTLPADDKDIGRPVSNSLITGEDDDRRVFGNQPENIVQVSSPRFQPFLLQGLSQSQRQIALRNPQNFSPFLSQNIFPPSRPVNNFIRNTVRPATRRPIRVNFDNRRPTVWTTRRPFQFYRGGPRDINSIRSSFNYEPQNGFGIDFDFFDNSNSVFGVEEQGPRSVDAAREGFRVRPTVRQMPAPRRPTARVRPTVRQRPAPRRPTARPTSAVRFRSSPRQTFPSPRPTQPPFVRRVPVEGRRKFSPGARRSQNVRRVRNSQRIQGGRDTFANNPNQISTNSRNTFQQTSAPFLPTSRTQIIDPPETFPINQYQETGELDIQEKENKFQDPETPKFFLQDDLFFGDILKIGTKKKTNQEVQTIKKPVVKEAIHNKRPQEPSRRFNRPRRRRQRPRTQIRPTLSPELSVRLQTTPLPVAQTQLPNVPPPIPATGRFSSRNTLPRQEFSRKRPINTNRIIRPINSVTYEDNISPEEVPTAQLPNFQEEFVPASRPRESFENRQTRPQITNQNSIDGNRRRKRKRLTTHRPIGRLADTDGDGSPGTAGVEYPIYSKIPKTSFSCFDQKSLGYYADPEAQCQVFHFCQARGVKTSFLCPNGTVYNQENLACEWWHNVDCKSSENHYHVNDRLYKDPSDDQNDY